MEQFKQNSRALQRDSKGNCKAIQSTKRSQRIPEAIQRQSKGNAKADKTHPKSNLQRTQRQSRGNPQGTHKKLCSNPKAIPKTIPRQSKGNPAATQGNPKTIQRGSNGNAQAIAIQRQYKSNPKVKDPKQFQGNLKGITA